MEYKKRKVTISTGKNKVIVTCLKCGHQWKAGKK